MAGLWREADLLVASALYGEEPQVKAKNRSYRPQRRSSEPALDALVAEYASGETAPQVAELFGIHRQTVARLLVSRGVATRSRARIDAKLLAELTWHYERGKSTVELGRQYGLAASSVRKALKKSGVTLRPPKFNRRTTRDGQV